MFWFKKKEKKPEHGLDQFFGYYERGNANQYPLIVLQINTALNGDKEALKLMKKIKKFLDRTILDIEKTKSRPR